MARDDGPPSRAAKGTVLGGRGSRGREGLVDFVTIEDALGLQSSDLTGTDDRRDQVRGRLDAVLVAAAVAPRTSNVGLVPSVVVTHTEPFHISKAIATLYFASVGRAGGAGQASAPPDEARHFGLREPLSWIADGSSVAGGAPEALTDLFAEAADYVEVVRRLWDSWEDGTEIRDAASGPVHRPVQAALHRFSGPLVQRERAIDHAPPSSRPAPCECACP